MIKNVFVGPNQPCFNTYVAFIEYIYLERNHIRTSCGLI